MRRGRVFDSLSKQILNASVFLELVLKNFQTVLQDCLASLNNWLALLGSALQKVTIADVHMYFVCVLQFCRDERDVAQGNHHPSC